MQKPHPPIWVGGESGPALRRTARLGDAWYPIGTNPANPLDSLARFKAQVARLRKDDRRKPGASRTRSASRCASPPTARTSRPRRATANGGSFSGKPADIAGDIKALRDIGVSHLDVGFGGTTVDAVLGEMQQFRKDVLPLV